eukprot:scaffold3782_cov83-Cylindrotheca_fusiformis.AAC.1
MVQSLPLCKTGGIWDHGRLGLNEGFMTLKEIGRFLLSTKESIPPFYKRQLLETLVLNEDLGKDSGFCEYGQGDFIPSTVEVIDYAPFHK